jgi:hypothetical protein
MRPDDVKPGDWVSFYDNGKIVIGNVRYVGLPAYGSYTEAMTDIGTIRLDYILEVRSEGHER